MGRLFQPLLFFLPAAAATNSSASIEFLKSRERDACANVPAIRHIVLEPEERASLIELGEAA